jgi:hypothetical protein
VARVVLRHVCYKPTPTDNLDQGTVAGDTLIDAVVRLFDRLEECGRVPLRPSAQTTATQPPVA